MRRYDLLKDLVKRLTPECPVVCNLGDPSSELYSIEDRPANFYMLGSMGLASSIGVGLALARGGVGKVVVVDGDGALLMNLGALSTVGRYQPPGLVWIVVDNGAHGSTGDQPTATTARCDLVAAAHACGIERATRVETLEAFGEAFQQAWARPGVGFIVVKTNTKKPVVPVNKTSGPDIRDRFMETIRR